MVETVAKTILITGSTDGIGYETAQKLLELGHNVLLHGRNPDKLDSVFQSLADRFPNAMIKQFLADMSDLSQVRHLANNIINQPQQPDVLINNAGIYGTADTAQTALGTIIDHRFVVNTLAPYLLTELLLPVFKIGSRVVNLSSAAQAMVTEQALAGEGTLEDHNAYAQSKLALTMWTVSMGQRLKSGTGLEQGPMVCAVNPGSLLGSKMVKQAFGMAGGDLVIGADILVRAALSDEFANAGGQYFDNDNGRFSAPHQQAQDTAECQKLEAWVREQLNL